MATGSSRVLRLTALGGLALVAVVGPRAAGVPALVLMLAPGVAVPLGLSIAFERDEPASTSVAGLPRRTITSAAPLAAAAGVLGWLAPPGHPGAIAAASLHAVVCALAGLAGLARLSSRRRAGGRAGPLHEIAIDVGLLLLPVAGVWLLASRAAMPLIGFEEPVVTFTAAHFHYAGSAAPTILGGVGRLLSEAPAARDDDRAARGDDPAARDDDRAARGRRATRALYGIAATAVCAGVPATAVGIATTPTIEAIAATTLAAGMLAAAALLVFVAPRRAAPASKLAAALFVVAGATLLVTMSLAATFALTSSAGRGSSLEGAIPLQTMIDWHGGANAIGFSLSGLAALALVASKRGRA
ncbi:MAG: YndJ family transporter [Labilithrix sp.]|nr:YndJ family transporter [Labilithrix sp.]